MKGRRGGTWVAPSEADAFREALLNSKALPARVADTEAVLARILRLKIDGWTEADVRAEIIDPLVRLLGYDKESYFSLHREKPVEVLGSHKAIDYSMTLFAENFWLIEAKRPHPATTFDRDSVYQALRYAAHPEINAALLVLCDGNKIEVFDREQTLKAPLLRIKREDLARDFDQLRSVLSPWQVFSFEKRRLLRLVDKVFDQETHLGRVEEMKEALDRRLVAKRSKVLDNMRARIDANAESNDIVEFFRTADAADVVETGFPLALSQAAMNAMVANLVGRCHPTAFRVTNRIFPEPPRDANACFWGHALAFLVSLHQAGHPTPILPTYLGGDGGIRSAVERLIQLCLTSFAADPLRRSILLYAAAARRLAKLQVVLGQRMHDLGELLHLVERFTGQELTFQQGVSSPGRHLLLLLDRIELEATTRFVRKHSEERRGFRLAAAEYELKGVWAIEKKVLASVSSYHDLERDAELGEIFPTEASGVTYDYLGHFALCVLERSPEWKDWTLAHHMPLVEQLARAGSWQARGWLGHDRLDDTLPKPTDVELADRFFLGDVETASTLRRAYGY